MRLAMFQMRMSHSLEENLQKTVHSIELAKEAGADLIFFPEVQLSPFFPQYEKKDAGMWLLRPGGEELHTIQNVCRKLHICACPNVYLQENGKPYDASVMIDQSGSILGVSKMVHIAQAEYFYEQDYYTPSDSGFKVYPLSFGIIGVVICFDRHIPDSILRCARQGAELIIIPTANIAGEPLELFEWEIRTQAFQNVSYIAMCNRVGQEGALTFAGQSLTAAPDGSLLFKAGGEEELLTVDIPLEELPAIRSVRPWLTLQKRKELR